MPLTLPDPVASTMAAARQAYVAVPSRHGPHVTPELYAWYGDRLWFAAAVSTLKAKVLGARPVAGAVISAPGRSVVLHGPVVVFDPRDPVGLARRLPALPAAGQAMARFTVRNLSDLVAFVGDTATGRLGWRLPPPRALFALAPEAAAVVENDAVTGAWGGWAAAMGGAAPSTAGAPDVPAGGEPAVLALPGPVAVPARWFRDERRVHAPAGLLDLVAADAGEVELSVVVDDYTAPGPAAKQGVLVRGRGQRVRAAPGYLAVEPHREVTWIGTDTASRPAGAR